MPHAQPHLVKHACSIPATCMLLSNCRGPHSIMDIQIRLLDMTGSFWDPHLAVVAELLLLKLAMTLKLELREGIRQDVSYFLHVGWASALTSMARSTATEQNASV